MIKSKIHINWYLWFFFIILCEVVLFTGLVKVIIKINNDVHQSYFSVIILMIIILFFLLVIKDFKYILIDNQKNQLTYYSILKPFGKILKLDDFDNKIKTSETSIRGEYEVIYLIKKKYTVFKINGLFYENLKEIDSCIKLKRIYNYKFNLILYLKLLFTGRIKIKEEK